MAELATSLKRDVGDRQRALDAAIGQIERAFGKGSVMRLGQRDSLVEIASVSTGSLGLDIALGVGGVPRGRIVEIYGPESSGKTTLTLHCIAEAQKAGGTAASSTPSTRSIPATPASWASISTSSRSRSRTPASRRSRSPTRWCAPARSTWW